MTMTIIRWGMSVAEAAAELNVSEQTVRRMFDDRPVGHPAGWLVGEWKETPTGRKERRIDPADLYREKTRRAELAARAAQPPTRPAA